jgi:2-furoyl-CoA dehydrogenase 2Fe-2S iron sulfur subunit
VPIRFTLNGEPVEVETEPRELLGSVLRERLGCRGVHVACGQGFCGACTVALDGEAVRSCLILAPQAAGREVRTIAAADTALQAALQRHGAVQCGYCTPGIVLSLRSLLHEVAAPGRDEIEEALHGHICRCTGYSAIVDAAVDAIGLRP